MLERIIYASPATMLWRLQLEREDGSDISSAAFSDSKQSQVKVVQSSTGLSFEQSDSKSIHVSPELIASIGKYHYAFPSRLHTLTGLSL